MLQPGLALPHSVACFADRTILFQSNKTQSSSGAASFDPRLDDGKVARRAPVGVELLGAGGDLALDSHDCRRLVGPQAYERRRKERRGLKYNTPFENSLKKWKQYDERLE